MNSLQILLSRMKKDLIYQLSVWKAVLDWTVMLYIFIPTVLAALYIYRSWWLVLPTWNEWVTLPVISIFLYLLAWQSINRTYVKEADGIFYVKYKKSFIRMKKFSFLFAFLKVILKIILVIIIALPFILANGSSLFEISYFSFYYIGLTFFIQTLTTTVRFLSKDWIYKIWLTALFIILFIGNLWVFNSNDTPFLLTGLGILFILLSLFIARPIVLSTRYFNNECLQDNERRLRFVSLFLSSSSFVEKPKIIKRKKPLLLKGKVFKKNSIQNGFIEVFIKIFIRNSAYFWGFFRLTGVTVTAVLVIPPIALKLLIILAFYFFINHWIGSLWDKIILAHPIGQRYSDSHEFYQAKYRIRLLFSVLTSLFLLLVAVLIRVFI